LSVLGSAGLQVQEELNCAFSGLAVAMALKMAESVDPTYITSLDSPGAMPIAWVMSSVCSVSSQPADSRQLVLVPSVESRVIGTLLVSPAFLKYVVRSVKSVP
jgi:hypothetical protein